jgi:hypothetical protein
MSQGVQPVCDPTRPTFPENVRNLCGAVTSLADKVLHMPISGRETSTCTAC